MRLLVLLIASLLFACSTTVYNDGVPNFYTVETGIVRSGQPETDAQWETIRTELDKQTGVRTHYDVKLNYDTEGTDNLARSHGFTVVYLPIPPAGVIDMFDPPSEIMLADIDSAIVSHIGDGVLVHCTHGQDRTGLAIARYRVLHEGWPYDFAANEWRDYGGHFGVLGLPGLTIAWDRLMP